MPPYPNLPKPTTISRALLHYFLFSVSACRHEPPPPRDAALADATKGVKWPPALPLAEFHRDGAPAVAAGAGARGKAAARCGLPRRLLAGGGGGARGAPPHPTHTTRPRTPRLADQGRRGEDAVESGLTWLLAATAADENGRWSWLRCRPRGCGERDVKSVRGPLLGAGAAKGGGGGAARRSSRSSVH